MKKLTINILALVCSISLWALPENGVVYVTPDGAGNKDGSSWENAMDDINEALTAALIPGNKKDVWVAGGEYKIDEPINLKDSINLYGSFAGTETSISERPQAVGAQPWEFENPTLLVANGDTRLIQARGHNKKESFVDGFTCTGGTGNSDVLKGNGGAVAAYTLTTYQNCIFRNNNASNGNGGAVMLRGGTVRYCLIENNSQTGGANGGGAVMSNPDSSQGGPSYIENCIIRGNSSTVRGGAINMQGGLMTYVRNCVIYGNRATDNTELKPGGAIYTLGGSNNEISNCIIYNNTGNSAIYHAGGYMYNNTVAANIGGIYLTGVEATVVNNVIWNCTTEDQTTPTSLTGASGGSSCYVLNNYTRNPISTENGWTLSEAEDGSNSNLQFPDNATNDTVWNTESGAFTGIGPCFINPNTFSVGAGETGDLEGNIEYWESLDWSLKPNSPLIDKGYALDILKQDITGMDRPQGEGWDIGAYEYQYFTVTLASIEGAEFGAIYDINYNDIATGTPLSFKKGAALNWLIQPNEGYEAHVTYTNADDKETDISESIDATNEGLCSWVVTEDMDITVVFREIGSGLHSLVADNIQLSAQNNLLTIKGLNLNDAISVYSVTGALVHRSSASQSEVSIPLNNGIYVVRVNNAVQKTIMK